MQAVPAPKVRSLSRMAKISLPDGSTCSKTLPIWENISARSRRCKASIIRRVSGWTAIPASSSRRYISAVEKDTCGLHTTNQHSGSARSDSSCSPFPCTSTVPPRTQ